MMEGVHWLLVSTGDGNEQWFVCGKDEMGDKEFKVGKIVGERTRWRKSSSTVNWPE